MAEVSRRAFLTTGAGAAVAGAALAAMPGIASAGAAEAPAAPAPGGATPELTGSGSYIVHVLDASKGEVSVMTGDTEVVIHDPALVARVVAHSTRSTR